MISNWLPYHFTNFQSREFALYHMRKLRAQHPNRIHRLVRLETGEFAGHWQVQCRERVTE